MERLSIRNVRISEHSSGSCSSGRARSSAILFTFSSMDKVYSSYDKYFPVQGRDALYNNVTKTARIFNRLRAVSCIFMHLA